MTKNYKAKNYDDFDLMIDDIKEAKMLISIGQKESAMKRFRWVKESMKYLEKKLK